MPTNPETSMTESVADSNLFGKKLTLEKLDPTARQVFHPEVLFAVLPFSQLSPALDASTLATMLRAENIPSQVVYFNRQFAHKINLVFYETAAASASLNCLLGDWVFRNPVFGAMDDHLYLKSLLDRGYISTNVIPAAIDAKHAASEFLNQCLNQIDWKTVKFLCLIDTYAKRDATSGKLMASLALASMVKRAHPSVTVILSGPTTELEMGHALIRLPYIDFICIDDVYSSLPSLVRDSISPYSSHLPAGVVSKTVHHMLTKFTHSRQRRLQLPIPDFSDYFSLQNDGLPGCFDSIPMATSRGCWWADHRRCLFCALPGHNATFQSKSSEGALEEFLVQIERYQPKRIEMNDLIIDPSYFNSFFPQLKKINNGVEIFYETKAHLRTGQLKMMADAGITKVQAGIETLSPRSLSLLSKGVRVQMNVQFLQSCNDIGIDCFWNYLHSIPGESASVFAFGSTHYRAHIASSTTDNFPTCPRRTF